MWEKRSIRALIDRIENFTQAFAVTEETQLDAVEMTANSEPSDSVDAAVLAVIKSEVERQAAELSEQSAGKIKSLNHELAQLRRKLKKSGQEPLEQAVSQDSHGQQLSRQDVAALIEVGNLRAKANLSQDALDVITGLDLSPSQEAAILGALASNQPVSQTARDAREIKRGTTSAPRQSAQIPTTQQEWLSLRKSDPRRFSDLNADPGFDPSDLPMR